MVEADDCQPDTYPEGGPCYPCAARHCCVGLAVCADNIKSWFDGGIHYTAYTECYDGPLACARQCFEREIGAAMSKASVDVAHDCAVECGEDLDDGSAFANERAEIREATNFRKHFIDLVDCLAELTEAPEPEEDGGAAPASCAASCFEGWR